ncbi:unnamed protein product [Plasmodium vivax]|uniref:(malaria parasite P. vivax) hypothetical protein n=1 Tax=Plasmodium vivax TaxID=5855 RepID=A0A8S4HC27_PLAVI|nr:unnamed protein product [Plasmodium vivax]
MKVGELGKHWFVKPKTHFSDVHGRKCACLDRWNGNVAQLELSTKSGSRKTGENQSDITTGDETDNGATNNFAPNSGIFKSPLCDASNEVGKKTVKRHSSKVNTLQKDGFTKKHPPTEGTTPDNTATYAKNTEKDPLSIFKTESDKILEHIKKWKMKRSVFSKKVHMPDDVGGWEAPSPGVKEVSPNYSNLLRDKKRKKKKTDMCGTLQKKFDNFNSGERAHGNYTNGEKNDSPKNEAHIKGKTAEGGTSHTMATSYNDKVKKNYLKSEEIRFSQKGSCNFNQLGESHIVSGLTMERKLTIPTNIPNTEGLYQNEQINQRKKRKIDTQSNRNALISRTGNCKEVLSSLAALRLKDSSENDAPHSSQIRINQVNCADLPKGHNKDAAFKSDLKWENYIPTSKSADKKGFAKSAKHSHNFYEADGRKANAKGFSTPPNNLNNAKKVTKIGNSQNVHHSATEMLNSGERAIAKRSIQNERRESKTVKSENKKALTDRKVKCELGKSSPHSPEEAAKETPRINQTKYMDNCAITTEKKRGDETSRKTTTRMTHLGETPKSNLEKRPNHNTNLRNEENTFGEANSTKRGIPNGLINLPKTNMLTRSNRTNESEQMGQIKQMANTCKTACFTNKNVHEKTREKNNQREMNKAKPTINDTAVQPFWDEKKKLGERKNARQPPSKSTQMDTNKNTKMIFSSSITEAPIYNQHGTNLKVPEGMTDGHNHASGEPEIFSHENHSPCSSGRTGYASSVSSPGNNSSECPLMDEGRKETRSPKRSNYKSQESLLYELIHTKDNKRRIKQFIEQSEGRQNACKIFCSEDPPNKSGTIEANTNAVNVKTTRMNAPPGNCPNEVAPNDQQDKSQKSTSNGQKDHLRKSHETLLYELINANDNKRRIKQFIEKSEQLEKEDQHAGGKFSTHICSTGRSTNKVKPPNEIADQFTSGRKTPQEGDAQKKGQQIGTPVERCPNRGEKEKRIHLSASGQIKRHGGNQERRREGEHERKHESLLYELLNKKDNREKIINFLKRSSGQESSPRFRETVKIMPRRLEAPPPLPSHSSSAKAPTAKCILPKWKFTRACKTVASKNAPKYPILRKYHNTYASQNKMKAVATKTQSAKEIKQTESSTANEKIRNGYKLMANKKGETKLPHVQSFDAPQQVSSRNPLDRDTNKGKDTQRRQIITPKRGERDYLTSAKLKSGTTKHHLPKRPKGITIKPVHVKDKNESKKNIHSNTLTIKKSVDNRPIKRTHAEAASKGPVPSHVQKGQSKMENSHRTATIQVKVKKCPSIQQAIPSQSEQKTKGEVPQEQKNSKEVAEKTLQRDKKQSVQKGTIKKDHTKHKVSTTTGRGEKKRKLLSSAEVNTRVKARKLQIDMIPKKISKKLIYTNWGDKFEQNGQSGTNEEGEIVNCSSNVKVATCRGTTPSVVNPLKKLNTECTHILLGKISKTHFTNAKEEATFCMFNKDAQNNSPNKETQMSFSLYVSTPIVNPPVGQHLFRALSNRMHNLLTTAHLNEVLPFDELKKKKLAKKQDSISHEGEYTYPSSAAEAITKMKTMLSIHFYKTEWTNCVKKWTTMTVQYLEIYHWSGKKSNRVVMHRQTICLNRVEEVKLMHPVKLHLANVDASTKEECKEPSTWLQAEVQSNQYTTGRVKNEDFNVESMGWENQISHRTIFLTDLLLKCTINRIIMSREEGKEGKKKEQLKWSHYLAAAGSTKPTCTQRTIPNRTFTAGSMKPIGGRHLCTWELPRIGKNIPFEESKRKIAPAKCSVMDYQITTLDMDNKLASDKAQTKEMCANVERKRNKLVLAKRKNYELGGVIPLVQEETDARITTQGGLPHVDDEKGRMACLTDGNIKDTKKDVPTIKRIIREGFAEGKGTLIIEDLKKGSQQIETGTPVQLRSGIPFELQNGDQVQLQSGNPVQLQNGDPTQLPHSNDKRTTNQTTQPPRGDIEKEIFTIKQLIKEILTEMKNGLVKEAKTKKSKNSKREKSRLKEVNRNAGIKNVNKRGSKQKKGKDIFIEKVKEKDINVTASVRRMEPSSLEVERVMNALEKGCVMGISIEEYVESSTREVTSVSDVSGESEVLVGAELSGADDAMMLEDVLFRNYVIVGQAVSDETVATMVEGVHDQGNVMLMENASGHLDVVVVDDASREILPMMVEEASRESFPMMEDEDREIFRMMDNVGRESFPMMVEDDGRDILPMMVEEASMEIFPMIEDASGEILPMMVEDVCGEIFPMLVNTPCQTAAPPVDDRQRQIEVADPVDELISELEDDEPSGENKEEDTPCRDAKREEIRQEIKKLIEMVKELKREYTKEMQKDCSQNDREKEKWMITYSGEENGKTQIIDLPFAEEGAMLEDSPTDILTFQMEGEKTEKEFQNGMIKDREGEESYQPDMNKIATTPPEQINLKQKKKSCNDLDIAQGDNATTHSSRQACTKKKNRFNERVKLKLMMRESLKMGNSNEAKMKERKEKEKLKQIIKDILNAETIRRFLNDRAAENDLHEDPRRSSPHVRAEGECVNVCGEAVACVKVATCAEPSTRAKKATFAHWAAKGVNPLGANPPSQNAQKFQLGEDICDKVDLRTPNDACGERPVKGKESAKEEIPNDYSSAKLERSEKIKKLMSSKRVTLNENLAMKRAFFNARKKPSRENIADDFFC